MGLLNSGGQPVPPGALLNIIYPASWNTFEGCNAEGLWVIGGPSIPSDEPLSDATQARLWPHAIPNPLHPGITNLLYFRVRGPAGRHQMVVRMAGTALSEAHLVDLPAESGAEIPPAELHQDESGELLDIRLIQGEVALGKSIIEAAIDVSQVYTTVADTQWRTHQARLAAIPEAGDAYELVVETWAGFEKYNSAVRQRTFISNDDLRSIARVAERTVGALRVAAEAVLARRLF